MTGHQRAGAAIVSGVAHENGVSYFSVASGGGTGRTLHPDNMAAGSSSVPAHVEMIGLIGAGNNHRGLV